MIHEKIEAPAAAGRELPRALRLTALAVLSLLAAYLLSPALTPVHPEGFTASVASLGIHLRTGALADFDTIQPLNVEFFGLSKLGWVLLTSALTGVGFSASGAMTVLTLLAFAGFGVGTILLVRRWTAAPAWAIAVTLLLFQGVSETAFFFNDNIIASALAVWALLALYLERRFIGAALCGALFAAAVLTRSDTVLISPAAMLVLVERHRSWRPVIEALTIAGAVGAAILFGTLALFNATVFDILTVAKAATSAWKSPYSANPALQMFFFLGIPGCVLVVGGMLSLLGKRDYRTLAGLLFVPAIFLGLLGSQLWVLRQLLPLTPFLAAIGATFLAGLAKKEGSAGQAVQLGLVVGISAIVVFGPLHAQRNIDGPRMLTGRVANVEKWRMWQDKVEQDFGLLQSLADVPAGKTRVLISDFWNDDRYSHLVIQEAGYRSVAAPAQCARVADIFEKGSSRIAVVRLHQVYVPYWRQLAAPRLQRWGIPCIEALPVDEITLVVTKNRLRFLLDEMSSKVPTFRQSRLLSGGNYNAAFLERADLPALVHAYTRLGEETAERGIRVPTIEAAEATARKRTDFAIKFGR